MFVLFIKNCCVSPHYTLSPCLCKISLPISWFYGKSCCWLPVSQDVWHFRWIWSAKFIKTWDLFQVFFFKEHGPIETKKLNDEVRYFTVYNSFNCLIHQNIFFCKNNLPMQYVWIESFISICNQWHSSLCMF